MMAPATPPLVRAPLAHIHGQLGRISRGRKLFEITNKGTNKKLIQIPGGNMERELIWNKWYERRIHEKSK